MSLVKGAVGVGALGWKFRVLGHGGQGTYRVEWLDGPLAGREARVLAEFLRGKETNDGTE